MHANCLEEILFSLLLDKNDSARVYLWFLGGVGVLLWGNFIQRQ